MAVLQKMSDILNNNETSEPLTNNKTKKTVTFRDPIPEPRVGRSAGDMQLSPKTLLSPTVVANRPTITKAIVDKPMHTIPISRPTTRSKYAQALADITERVQPMRGQSSLNMTELAQSRVDDNPTAATGKLALSLRKGVSGPDQPSLCQTRTHRPKSPVPAGLTWLRLYGFEPQLHWAWRKAAKP